MNRIMTAVIIMAMATQFGCSEKKVDRGVDLVNGIRPVSLRLYNEHIWVEQLATMKPGEREQHIRKAAPHLEKSVVFFLKRAGKIPQNATVSRVQLLYGDLENLKGEDGEGKVHNGYVQNQLIARVFVNGSDKPYDALVRCLNGVFDLPENGLAKMQNLGNTTPIMKFAIGKREGLIHHVDYQTAMDIAERFGLDLYRGKKMTDQRKIDVAEARGLQNETDRIQVTVRVYEGDQFDLDTMTYTKAPLPQAPTRHHKRTHRRHRHT